MKNNKILFLLMMIVFLGVACMCSSCKDWTEVKPESVDNPDIKKQDPKVYAEYLKELRAYKANNSHKLICGWFDNSEKQPYNRAQHLTDIPDSVDVVALMHPDSLADWEQKEIASIRSDKGMKVIFSVRYETLKASYDAKFAQKQKKALLAGEPQPQPDSIDYIQFMADTLSYVLKIANKYKYDGLSIGFLGKSTLHMTDKEKLIYGQEENAFIGILDNWANRNLNRMIVFEGLPQNLVHKDILKKCTTILLPETAAQSAENLTKDLLMAAVDGVPSDRLGIIVSSTSLDDTDKKTGYFLDGSRALPVAGRWAAGDFGVCSLNGFGIYNLSNDYFNTSMVYQYSRKAIESVNPSIKN